MKLSRNFLKQRAKALRNNMTDAENRLWYEIRRDRFGFRFYRQKILSRYIVDFYCPKARLVIEVDGGQHFEESGADSDRTRDSYLISRGLTVLRFANNEVLNEINQVLEKIWLEIEKQKVVLTLEP